VKKLFIVAFYCFALSFSAYAMNGGQAPNIHTLSLNSSSPVLSSKTERIKRKKYSPSHIKGQSARKFLLKFMYQKGQQLQHQNNQRLYEEVRFRKKVFFLKKYYPKHDSLGFMNYLRNPKYLMPTKLSFRKNNGETIRIRFSRSSKPGPFSRPSVYPVASNVSMENQNNTSQ